MSIYAVTGEIGSGKSLFQLFFALELAEKKEKQLVFNFPVNRFALKLYAQAMGYKWILNLIEHGGISEFHAPKNLRVLMKSNSVVCLDEAGVLLNSRSWKDTPKDFLADLCQSRKRDTDLVWSAQFSEQVDSQMRMLTQYWIVASGLTYYHKPSRLPRLYYKRYYFMTASQHNRYCVKPVSHLRARFMFSYRYVGGFLSATDTMLFDCFDSSLMLDRIDYKERSYHREESLDYCRLIDRPKTLPYFNQYDYEKRADLMADSDSYTLGSVLQSKILSTRMKTVIDKDNQKNIKMGRAS